MEPFDERIISQIWSGQHLRQGWLVTTDHQRLRVVWRGRLNHGDAGPDFRDAILALEDGTLLHGDIELHLRASDWWTHGHQRDPRYNCVILHVVLYPDTARALERADGGSAPVLDLGNHLEMPLAELVDYLKTGSPARECNDPCRQKVAALVEQGGGPVMLQQVGTLLDESGNARFEQKVALYENNLAALKAEDCGQIAYEAVADALGYSRNRSPFLRLARRAPLAFVLPLAQKSRSDAEAVLLGAAGLLPDSGTATATGLEEFKLRAQMADSWSRYARIVAASALDPHPLSRAGWQWGHTRPDNYPPRRTIALAYLLAYRSQAAETTGWPLLDELLETVRSTAQTGPSATRASIKALHLSLTVPADGYWAEHCDWGGKRLGGSAGLVGAARAAEIVINVILPFAAAYGSLTGDSVLARAAHRLYTIHPRTGDNATTKEMLDQILGAGTPDLRAAAPKLADSARRQQGLLHIHAHWCKLHVCSECAFAKPESNPAETADPTR